MGPSSLAIKILAFRSKRRILDTLDVLEILVIIVESFGNLLYRVVYITSLIANNPTFVNTIVVDAGLVEMTPISRMSLLQELLADEILEFVLKNVDRFVDLIAKIQEIKIALMEEDIQVRRWVLVVYLLEVLSKLFMRGVGLGFAEFEVVDVYKDVLVSYFFHILN